MQCLAKTVALEILFDLLGDISDANGDKGAYSSLFGLTYKPCEALLFCPTSLGFWKGLPQMVQKFYAIKTTRLSKGETGTTVSILCPVVVAGGCYFPLVASANVFCQRARRTSTRGSAFDGIVPTMMESSLHCFSDLLSFLQAFCFNVNTFIA